jgi:hypothetical protein
MPKKAQITHEKKRKEEKKRSSETVIFSFPEAYSGCSNLDVNSKINRNTYLSQKFDN